MADWRAAAVLAALAVLSAAPQAAAQDGFFENRSANRSEADRTDPEYAALGVPFGAFIIRPMVEAGVETDDNFFAADHNVGAQDETLYTLRGAADIASDWSNHALRLSLGARRQLHDKYPKDDSTTGHVAGDFRLDVRRSTQVGVGGVWQKLAEERTAADATAGAMRPVEYQYDNLYLYGGHTFNRIRVTARASREDYDYDDGVDTSNVVFDQDFRDHDVDTGTLRVEYLVSPRMALLLEGVWNDRSYDTSSSRDSNGRAYTAGASFEIARFVDGEIKVGYLEQEYDNPAIGTIDGAAFNADVDWYPTELTTVSFTLDRQVEESGTPGNASYLLSRAGVTVDHALLRNVVLSLGVEGGTREYEGADREDDYSIFELSGNYLLNRRVSVRAGLSRERVNSVGVDRNRDFDANRAFVSLAYRL